MLALVAASKVSARMCRATRWRCGGRQARALSVQDDLAALTGMTYDPSEMMHLPPSRRASFMGVLAATLAQGQVTPEIRAWWHKVISGGITLPGAELLERHDEAAREVQTQAVVDVEQGIYRISDEISEEHVCAAPLESLRQMSISDLEVDTVHTGRVLWVTLAADGVVRNAVEAVVDDDYGNSTRLHLYNAVCADRNDVAETFPRGLRLAVKEPYCRVGTIGLLQIRVDNPCNVVRYDAADNAKSAAAVDEAAALRAMADAGNVFGAVRVELVDGRGRGLLTTRAVRRGELLVKERALAVALTSKKRQIVLERDGKTREGVSGDLVPALVSRLQHDAVLRARVESLYDGGPRQDAPDMALFTGCALQQYVPQVSAARAARVLAVNAFGVSSRGVPGAALFALVSFLNHAETANVMKLYNEDEETFHVFALHDLEAGTELVIDYLNDLATDADAERDARRSLHGIPSPAARHSARPASAVVEAIPAVAEAPRTEPRRAALPPKPLVLFTQRPPKNPSAPAPAGKKKQRKR
ncbi:hypothetical protein M885DRAFT_521833 [Pelagophyceae sp. CCMP2097]|nr:hypothetical protein M885DRAFT_521833 [Pelagophyceae sp. CCMP2097]